MEYKKKKDEVAKALDQRYLKLQEEVHVHVELNGREIR